MQIKIISQKLCVFEIIQELIIASIYFFKQALLTVMRILKIHVHMLKKSFDILMTKNGNGMQFKEFGASIFIHKVIW